LRPRVIDSRVEPMPARFHPRVEVRVRPPRRWRRKQQPL